MKFDLEKQIGEKDELLTEKDIQIGMMKSQMNILIKEIEQYKKNNANAQPLSLLTPTGIVKKIRGGNHNSGILTNSTPLNTDFSDSATLETGRGSSRFTDSKNVGRVKSPPPITLFTSRTNPSKIGIII